MQTTTVIPPHTQQDGYYQKVLTKIKKLEPSHLLVGMGNSAVTSETSSSKSHHIT